LKEPFKVENGYVQIPTKPGLGIELDEAQVAERRDHNWLNRETYDVNDGSVVDW
jgi:galactonate dehydratase